MPRECWRVMAHNGHMADVDWDAWLDRLIEEKAARQSADIRAYLIAEISRAISNSDALRAGEDSIIESTRKNRIRPS